MNKIVLNDGTEILNGSITKNFASDQLFVLIPNKTILEVTLLFSDPQKTEKMESYADIRKSTFIGYTKIDSIGIDNTDGSIQMYMSGDENSSISTIYTVPEVYLPEDMRSEKEDDNGTAET